MRLLARREHSQLELRRKLAVRHLDAAAMTTVLADLVEKGYQSDQRFAEVYVRQRAAAGYGPLRIKLELNERGIAADLIDEYLDLSDEFWLDNALKVKQKKFGECEPNDFATKAKQLRFLQYRGFEINKL